MRVVQQILEIAEVQPADPSRSRTADPRRSRCPAVHRSGRPRSCPRSRRRARTRPARTPAPVDRQRRIAIARRQVGDASASHRRSASISATTPEIQIARLTPPFRTRARRSSSGSALVTVVPSRSSTGARSTIRLAARRCSRGEDQRVEPADEAVDLAHALRREEDPSTKMLLSDCSSWRISNRSPGRPKTTSTQGLEPGSADRVDARATDLGASRLGRADQLVVGGGALRAPLARQQLRELAGGAAGDVGLSALPSR